MEKQLSSGSPFHFIRQWRNHLTWILKLDVWILEGHEKHSGDELILAYAGLDGHKNYFANVSLKAGWKEHYFGREWVWRVLALVRRKNPSCSLLVYEVGKHAERFLERSNPLRSPVWVMFELSLGENHISTPSLKYKYKHMQQRIEKHAFTSVVTKNESDFDDFYHNMYVPNIQKRHGESSEVHDHLSLKKRFLSHCELILIHKDGKAIAGGILDYSEPVCRLLCSGIRDASEELMKMGISDALYYFAIARLREKGAAMINLGYCRAFFNNGAFRYKIEIGGRVANAHDKPSGCLRFKFLKDTEGLRNFLCKNPFVAVDSHKKYRGILFTKEPLLKEKLEEELDTRYCRGIRDVTVYTFNNAREHSTQTAKDIQVRFSPASSVIPVS